MTKSKKKGGGTRPKAFRVAPLQVEALVEWMKRKGDACVMDVAIRFGPNTTNAKLRLQRAEKDGLVRFKPGGLSQPDRWTLEPEKKEKADG